MDVEPSARSRVTSLRLRFGTAGWSIPRSAAHEFPGEGAHLVRYAGRLPCAEINTTFYRPPRVSTWERWAASVPADFRFAVKMPRTITHEAKLAGGGEDLKAFLSGAALLGDKLGPVLVQLPPKLAYEPVVAREFFARLRGEYPGDVALEPRNASWFTEEVSDLLREFRVARVAADPARVPEAALPGGWDGLRYWRLHGSPRIYYSAYSAEFLAQLAEQVRAFEAEAWVIFDNTALGEAAHNVLHLRDLLLPA